MASATPTPSKLTSSLKRFPSTASSQVRVVIRIRPFLPAEIGAGRETPLPCISLIEDPEDLRSDKEVTVHIKDQFSSRNECYKLDSFFSQDDDLGEIFEREVRPVVPGIFRGLNATVFAYGATGSGKTYTMQGTDVNPGLIPKAMSMILDMSEETGSSVEVSYYEIYLDRCYDLLELKAMEIPVLEDRDGSVQLKGLSLVPIRSMAEFNEVFSCGVRRRKVAHTGLNDVSSRSHGVLSVVVSNGGAKGKLNLIDLAGNEDNRRTCNEGLRLQESAKINQSLFALSNVIYALNNNETRVPYRESKLTRILQDSLGGTSRALMVACLNPGSYPEAVHTVSLAARSRHIGNYMGSKQETPKVKVDMEAKLLSWLESKGKTKSIQRLNGPRSPFPGSTPVSASFSTSRKASRNNSVSALSRSTGMGFSKGSAPRKLFDSAAPSLPFANEKPLDSEVSESLKGNTDVCLIDGGHHVTAESLETSVNEQIGLPGNELNADYSPAISDCVKIALPAPDPDLKSDTVQSIFNSYDNLGNSKVSGNLHTDNVFCNDQSRDEIYLHTPVSKVEASPPLREKVHNLQRSIRKVLSPLNSNPTPSKNRTLDERLCIILMEPKTPSVFNQDGVEHKDAGTPLDKLNALSWNLKDSLAKEYLAFLNSASKEELLALKGIGQKRAEYISELRETTPQPFKSLSDLEKIGLSSKQAHDLFRRSARGIF